MSVPMIRKEGRKTKQDSRLFFTKASSVTHLRLLSCMWLVCISPPHLSYVKSCRALLVWLRLSAEESVEMERTFRLARSLSIRDCEKQEAIDVSDLCAT